LFIGTLPTFPENFMQTRSEVFFAKVLTDKQTTTEVIMYKLHHCVKMIVKLERGPMPNVMTALPSMGGALCSTPQSLADAHYHSAMQ